MKSIWTGLVMGAALTLAGCGGGGGGGGGAEPAPVPLASAVRIANVQPQQISGTVPEAETPMAGFEISADVTGDLSA